MTELMQLTEAVTAFWPTSTRLSLMSAMPAFAHVRRGDVVVVPYCADGALALAPLLCGGRCVAVHPEAAVVRASRILLRPLSLPAFAAAVERALTVGDGISQPPVSSPAVTPAEEALAWARAVAAGARDTAGGERLAAACDRVVTVKRLLNERLPAVRVAAAWDGFRDGAYDALVCEADPFAVEAEALGLAAHIVLTPALERAWSPERLAEYLSHLHAATSGACTVILLPASPSMTVVLADAGWEARGGGAFARPVRAGRGGGAPRWFIVAVKEGQASPDEELPASVLADTAVVGADAVSPYIRVASVLGATTDPVRLRVLTAALAPEALRDTLSAVPRTTLAEMAADRAVGMHAYRALTAQLLRACLAPDGWHLTGTADAVGTDFGEPVPGAPGVVEGAVLEAADDSGRRLAFFFADQGDAALRRCAAAVAAADRDHFAVICVLILPDDAALRRYRQGRAAGWPRGFFISFEQLRRLCARLAPAAAAQLLAPPPAVDGAHSDRPRIVTADAAVTANIPVGGEGATHYKLRFRAPGLQTLVPGQFVMVDTKPTGDEYAGAQAACTRPRRGPAGGHQAYLKRPFGIHRAFYPGFPADYLRRLRLPPELATIVHTALPEQLDLLYKVQPHGVGTAQMTRLRPGDRFAVVGPLGAKFDLPALRRRGIEEVHVIGGGVGMAPLIFMVQALRFCSFRVKAFLGVASMAVLRHADELAASYVEDPGDVWIYIDDLLAAGVSVDDIYVSCDHRSELDTRVPAARFHHGFVSNQYRCHLATRAADVAGVLAFACGPAPMMRATATVAEEFGVPLKLLLEKRMACGIGVCLSCVCRTRSGKAGYSRVCTEGPIFDASEIIWD